MEKTSFFFFFTTIVFFLLLYNFSKIKSILRNINDLNSYPYKFTDFYRNTHTQSPVVQGRPSLIL